MSDLRPGYFMTGNAWVEDGRLWIAHDCTDHREIHAAPFPTWQADDDKVKPSYSCDLCGFHAVIWIGEPERPKEANDG